VSSPSQSNVRINATFVENKCNFLTFLLQQKLVLMMSVHRENIKNDKQWVFDLLFYAKFLFYFPPQCLQWSSPFSLILLLWAQRFSLDIILTSPQNMSVAESCPGEGQFVQVEGTPTSPQEKHHLQIHCGWWQLAMLMNEFFSMDGHLVNSWRRNLMSSSVNDELFFNSALKAKNEALKLD